MGITFELEVEPETLARKLSNSPAAVVELFDHWADPNVVDQDALIEDVAFEYPASVSAQRIAPFLRKLADALDEVDAQEER